MEAVVSKMPMQCKRCGAFFDLSYDLEDGDEQLVWALAKRLRVLGNKGSLCWSCRNFS